jgi:hypothetical protein
MSEIGIVPTADHILEISSFVNFNVPFYYSHERTLIVHGKHRNSLVGRLVVMTALLPETHLVEHHDHQEVQPHRVRDEHDPRHLVGQH